MRQFFYLIGHDIVGDDFKADKIFLQEYEAIRWGRKLATKNPDYNVYLYKQEITRTGELEFVKGLGPYKTSGVEPFDWDSFEAQRDLTMERK